jgi:hypothetical protein
MQKQMYEKSKYRRLMLIAAISFAMGLMVAGCVPTYAPHIDAPQIDEPAAVELEPLRPAPQLPDVDQSLTSCPAGSGFVACFTPAQDGIRQRRFMLLHEDRDYCRDAYEKAVKHAAGN